MSKFSAYLCLFFLAAFLCGCGGPSYSSLTVSGRVTIDGAAVPKGYVQFGPVGDTSGPAVAAEIHDGDYRCEKVPQGKVRATFIAQAAEPTTVFDKANNCTHEVPKDILPPSCRDGLPAEITAGENRLDFPLKSKGPGDK